MSRASAEAKTIVAPPECKHSAAPKPAAVADLKARQSAKIKELAQALIHAGLRTLDDQAEALGLSRSTAWTILKARHKSSGLSAVIIERMLGSSKLPPRAREILLQYVEEKAFGLYGGNRRQQRRFAAHLLNIIKPASESQEPLTENGKRRDHRKRPPESTRAA
jgi:hypothetical protein